MFRDYVCQQEYSGHSGGFGSCCQLNGELTEVTDLVILIEGIGRAEYWRPQLQAFLETRGGIAQLGERYNRTVEVGGSNPPASTTAILYSDLLRP